MLKFFDILDRLFSFHCVLEFLSCFSMVQQVLYLVLLLLVMLVASLLVLLLQLVVIH